MSDAMTLYDVIIIGGGPAGLSAGLYAGRSKLNTLIVERDALGGQIVITDEVANYPACIPEETGPTLVKRMVNQSKNFGATIVKDNIIGVDLLGKIKTVTGEKDTYHAKTVIIANGGKPRVIGCPGEYKLIGKGVSYCATCDADFFVDMEVFVVGGGDTALEEAIYLTKFARKVTLIHRRDALRAAKSIQERALHTTKLEFMWNTVVKEIKGDGIVQSIVLQNTKTDEINEYMADENDGTFGVFVFIGFDADSSLYTDVIQMDDAHYILTDDGMRTNIPGVYAAGDIRVKALRQVVTAASDGAIAATEAEKYISEWETRSDE